MADITLKNCVVTIHGVEKVAPGNWRVVQEQGRTYIEIILDDLIPCVIEKRIETANIDRKVIAKKYNLPLRG